MPPRGTVRRWLISMPSGRRLPSILRTCPRMVSIPATRAIRRARICSQRHWVLAVLGPSSKPSSEADLTPDDGAIVAVVEAHDVQKTYRLGRVRVPALRGVTLRIERGAIVAIVGPSGCGKTTLLHCLSGLEDFDSGEVWLEGQSLARMSDAAKADHRARRVGFVFQS